MADRALSAIAYRIFPLAKRVSELELRQEVNNQAGMGHDDKFDLGTYPVFGERLAKIQKRLKTVPHQRGGALGFKVAIWGIHAESVLWIDICNYRNYASMDVLQSNIGAEYVSGMRYRNIRNPDVCLTGTVQTKPYIELSVLTCISVNACLKSANTLHRDL